LEAIKVKILIMGEEQNPLTLRIELTSENDLFFHFNHNLDEHGFRQVSNSACPSAFMYLRTVNIAKYHHLPHAYIRTNAHNHMHTHAAEIARERSQWSCSDLNRM